MTDLIERLRARYCSNCNNERGKGHQDDCIEAADELERLQQECARIASENACKQIDIKRLEDDCSRIRNEYDHLKARFEKINTPHKVGSISK